VTWGAALVAAALAVVWWVVVPEEAVGATGWRAVALRWGHSLSWALLAVLAVLMAEGAPRRLRAAVGGAAAASYAAFLAAVVT